MSDEKDILEPANAEPPPPPPQPVEPAREFRYDPNASTAPTIQPTPPRPPVQPVAGSGIVSAAVSSTGPDPSTPARPAVMAEVQRTIGPSPLQPALAAVNRQPIGHQAARVQNVGPSDRDPIEAVSPLGASRDDEILVRVTQLEQLLSRLEHKPRPPVGVDTEIEPRPRVFPITLSGTDGAFSEAAVNAGAWAPMDTVLGRNCDDTTHTSKLLDLDDEMEWAVELADRNAGSPCKRFVRLAVGPGVTTPAVTIGGTGETPDGGYVAQDTWAVGQGDALVLVGSLGAGYDHAGNQVLEGNKCAITISTTGRIVSVASIENFDIDDPEECPDPAQAIASNIFAWGTP